MKIDIRTPWGWSKVEQYDGDTCTKCLARLYEAPHGGIYCNAMHEVHYKIGDNLGKTADRYSLYVEVGEDTDIYNFSENPLSPQGVNQYSCTNKGKPEIGEDEKILELGDLNAQVQIAMIERLEDYL